MTFEAIDRAKALQTGTQIEGDAGQPPEGKVRPKATQLLLPRLLEEPRIELVPGRDSNFVHRMCVRITRRARRCRQRATEPAAADRCRLETVPAREDRSPGTRG